jgi:polyferredoxin
MTLQSISRQNSVPISIIRRALENVASSDYTTPLSELNMTPIDVEKKIKEELIRAAYLGPPNMKKSWLKLGLWLCYLVLIFIIIRKTALTKIQRMLLYLIPIILFGIVLGAEPSPMRAIKTFIVYYGRYHTLTRPAVGGLVLFLLIGVIIANKFICSWACQFGTLQDFLFRLFRDHKDRQGMIPQKKVPFWLSNTIRLLFCFSVIVSAVLFLFDVLNAINPFNIFHPQLLTLYSAISLVILLLSSMIVYRPFCHFFCPFGLLGWICEKVSFYKIRVNPEICTNCKACEKACPSNAMQGILAKKTFTKADCFSCGTCISACPVKAISFGGRSATGKK